MGHRIDRLLDPILVNMGTLDAGVPLRDLIERMKARGTRVQYWDRLRTLCLEALACAEGSSHADQIATLSVHCAQRRPVELLAGAINVLESIEAERRDSSVVGEPHNDY